jgi:hypothetical protein
MEKKPGFQEKTWFQEIVFSWVEQQRPLPHTGRNEGTGTVATHGSDGVHTSVLEATFDDGADSSYLWLPTNLE